MSFRCIITLISMLFISACSSPAGEGWYESKDWGSWAKSDGGRWYGDGTDEEEESWWCKYMSTCEKEKPVACTMYGQCDKDGDGDADKDDEKKTAGCSFYGNCPE